MSWLRGEVLSTNPRFFARTFLAHAGECAVLLGGWVLISSCGSGCSSGWCSQQADGCDFTQEGELALAAMTEMGLGLGKQGLRVGVRAEVKAHDLPCAHGGRAQESVVAHSRKTFGQDVK